MSEALVHRPAWSLVRSGDAVYARLAAQDADAVSARLFGSSCVIVRRRHEGVCGPFAAFVRFRMAYPEVEAVAAPSLDPARS